MNGQYVLPSFANLKVVVIGDIMLDHYVIGDTNRSSPATGAPIVKTSEEWLNAGGAANVAVNLANLGVSTQLLGTIGNDDAGDKLKEILGNANVNLVVGGADRHLPATITKTRILNRNQHVCRVDREAHPRDYCLDSNPYIADWISNHVVDYDAVIFSDYGKGVVTNKLLALACWQCKSQQTLVAVDPKYSNSLNLDGINILTPNRKEAAALADIPDATMMATYPLAQVCKRIHDRLELEILVVTLDQDGLAVSTDGNIDCLLPAFATKNAQNVSGAGDTVVAVFTALIASGWGVTEAAKAASAAASCVVASVGTAPVNRNELNACLGNPDSIQNR